MKQYAYLLSEKLADYTPPGIVQVLAGNTAIDKAIMGERSVKIQDVRSGAASYRSDRGDTTVNIFYQSFAGKMVRRVPVHRCNVDQHVDARTSQFFDGFGKGAIHLCSVLSACTVMPKELSTQDVAVGAVRLIFGTVQISDHMFAG